MKRPAGVRRPGGATTLHVYLMRHGESVNNAGLPAVPDAPLTPLGRTQALALAGYWRRAAEALRPRLSVVVSSPLWRALETAEPLVAAMGLPWLVWPELVEWNRSFPSDGRLPDEARARFRGPRWDPEPESYRWPAYPGTESDAQAAERAGRMADRLRSSFAADTAVALIGHGSAGNMLLRHWLGVLKAPTRFVSDNAHMHALEIDGGSVRLQTGNACPWEPAAPPAAWPRPFSGLPDAAGAVFLVRHGQSAANLTGARIPDPELTPVGERQSAATGRLLATLGVRRVVCSPLVRSLASASAVAAAAAAPLHVWNDLVERNAWAPYRAQPLAALRSRFPRARFDEALPEDGLPVHGPEPDAGTWGRARAVADRLASAAARGERVAAVAHGTLGSMVLACLAGAARCHAAFGQSNAGVSCVWWDDRPRVQCVNFTAHLRGLA